MHILLFGGTSEGRELAEWLAGEGVGVTLCVATGYGASLIPSDPRHPCPIPAGWTDPAWRG